MKKATIPPAPFRYTEGIPDDICVNLESFEIVTSFGATTSIISSKMTHSLCIINCKLDKKELNQSRTPRVANIYGREWFY